MQMNFDAGKKSIKEVIASIIQSFLVVKSHISDVTSLSRVALWVGLIVASYGLGLLGRLANVPAAHLLAGLLVGIGVALPGLVNGRLPRPAYRWVQGLVGVMMGSYMDLSSLQSAAPAALPLTAVTAATVVLSIWVAFRLSRKGNLDRPTATLSMVPGAASAMTVAADDLDVDIRVVGVSQYLRLGLVAMATPLVATSLATEAPAANQQAGGAVFGGLAHLVDGNNQLGGLAVLIALAALGMRIGTRLSLPAAAVLGPMLVAACATSTDAVHGFAPAGLLQEIVFVLVGLEVGLRFTRRSIVEMRSVLPRILVGSIVVLLGCAVLAAGLAALTNLSLLDAYLATTPGGIYLVIPVALALHANLALVSTVQSLRLFVVVLLAPPLVRWALQSEIAKETPPTAVKQAASRGSSSNSETPADPVKDDRSQQMSDPVPAGRD